MNYLLVFVGGGLGASLRHFVNVTCAKCIGVEFPWGTFIINISGSIVMGLIAGYLAFRGEATQHWRLFLMTGFADQRERASGLNAIVHDVVTKPFSVADIRTAVADALASRRKG